jgi:cobyrinic acid a,c-diamide synthase
LVQPAEVTDIKMLLDKLAEQLVFDEAAWNRLKPVRIELPEQVAPVTSLLTGKTIAIARDAAFAFLYPANLDCLRELGATLKFFSPLVDEPVPQDADAVYLPGGYPELHAATLSQAVKWQKSIRQLHAAGVPIWAECGGMMAITDALVDHEGQSWPMAGLLAGRVLMQTRLAGIGPQGMPLPQGVVRGHTFHYSRMETDIAPLTCTAKHPSGDNGEAVYRVGSLTASYFHAYFPSCPAAVAALFSKNAST